MARIAVVVKRIAKGIDSLNEHVGSLLGITVVAMTVVVTYSVVMRYFFTSQVLWSWELLTHLLIAMAALAGGYTLLHEAHVKVDILYSRFRPRVRAAIDLVTFLVFFIFVACLTWKGFDIAIRSLMEGKCSCEVTRWPLAPSQFLLAFGFVLIGLQGLNLYIRNVLILLKKEHFWKSG